MTSFAYDGKWLYFFFHAENRFHKRRSANADLSRLLSLPIKVADIISLMSGRAPIKNPGGASLIPNKTGNGYVLIIEKGWWQKQIAKIYLLDDQKSLWKYEQYDQAKRLVYRVELFDPKNFEGFQIPRKLIFSDESMVRLEILIEKYWPNANLASSLFVLNPPN